jgi:hypothetical protein
MRQVRLNGEDPDYDKVSPETMEILPTNFATEDKQMLSHLYLMINEGYLRHTR